MKKKLSLLLALLLVFSIALTACSSSDEGGEEAGETGETGETGGEIVTVKVGASITPHAEILEAARADFEAKGYKLEILEYTDYVQPNIALDDGSLDANYFQHQPYLDSFNADNGTKVVAIGTVHYEPIGIYPGKVKALADLPDGATVAVPNDATNEARALLLLEANGLIDLNDAAGIEATVLDIVDNPKNLKFEELEAAQVAFALQDVDIAVINGNYAIQAGLSAANDALAIEDKNSIAATTYANILCVKEGNEQNKALTDLLASLQTDAVAKHIEDSYDGAVVPAF